MSLKTKSLSGFLDHKTMYYDKIDFSFVNRAFSILEKEIKIPFVIHIVGTNGKGSTGRFLSHYLYKTGFKTLHYSSPHIKKFNERIWINGADVSDNLLQNAHEFLTRIYDEELLLKLTYFEYTTLLALYLSKDCEYLVLEAGLGGEFDATNVVKNDLSLITTIGLDHISFLGNSIEKIARTKMRATNKKMIIGYQEFQEVFEVAQKVKEELKEEFNTDIEILKVENFELANSISQNLEKQFPSLKISSWEVIESEFDNETGNIAFRASFPNHDKLLRNGETGKVLMTVPVKNALIIPQKATYEIQDKKYVFVVENNVVKSVEITVTGSLPDLYIVQSGITAKDKVLLEGVQKVKENDKIKFEYQKPEEVINHLRLKAE
ncbi:Mur ligase family protein [Flavobacterium croceum]|uniref:Mur ligase family protein n=1 Tax=Flavobacterium croceum TaxID=370975 RepID=UPI0024A93C72|nr:Mur ligase family protein [Flavobacterium croceum]